MGGSEEKGIAKGEGKEEVIQFVTELTPTIFAPHIASMRHTLLITPLLFALASCNIVKAVRDNSKSNKTEVQAAVSGTHILPFELENNKIIVKVNITHDGTEHVATLMLD